MLRAVHVLALGHSDRDGQVVAVRLGRVVAGPAVLVGHALELQRGVVAVVDSHEIAPETAVLVVVGKDSDDVLCGAQRGSPALVHAELVLAGKRIDDEIVEICGSCGGCAREARCAKKQQRGGDGRDPRPEPSETHSPTHDPESKPGATHRHYRTVSKLRCERIKIDEVELYGSVFVRPRTGRAQHLTRSKETASWRRRF